MDKRKTDALDAVIGIMVAVGGSIPLWVGLYFIFTWIKEAH